MRAEGVLRTATQSMISDNRGNNGLGPIIIDADLMPLASEQARATAAGDRMGRAFQERMCKAGFGGSAAVENVGATTRSPTHSPAGAIRRRIAPTAQSGRHPHGDRRGLCAEVEVRGVLGTDLRWARRPSRLSTGTALFESSCAAAIAVQSCLSK
jgi:hypothetical protein